MNVRLKRVAVIACALPVLTAAAPDPAAPAGSEAFPARTSGSEGTTLTIQAAGESERLFQAEKERKRIKAEQERLEREAAEKKAAEAARIERERVAAEQAAALQAQTAADTAAAAAKAKALETRMASMKTPGELFALSDELTAAGDVAGSRAALRMLIARFPDHKFANMAATMLTGVAVPGTAAPAEPAAAPAPAVDASKPNACLSSILAFNAARPAGTTTVSLVELQVFYGKYYERLLKSVPACRTDTATQARVRADVQANLAACQKIAGANCSDGVPDTAISSVELAYEKVVAQAQSTSTEPKP